jgi:hypothetical protein
VRRVVMRASLVLATTLAVQPACAQVRVAPAALEVSLASGGFEELCFELGVGESMRYSFDAGAPLDFNLHWHHGNDVRFPVRIDAVARLGGVFRAPEKQAYCLMWTNRGRGGVSLRARIDRAD